MKIRVALIIFLIAIVLNTRPASALNGSLHPFGNQRVLHVWGTHYEMGYAHGFLLADDIMSMMEVYAFPPPGEGTWLYDWARSFVLENFIFDEGMIEETRGMYQGMLDAGMPTFVPALNRDFDANDLLTYSSLGEVTGLFCTTLIAWNSATALDPVIDGALAVVHNTDYVMEPEDAFIGGSKGLVIAYSPDDPEEQRFFTVAYPGFIGLIAGMNESSIGLVVNKGHIKVPASEWQWEPRMEPAAWYARQAVALRLGAGDEPEKIQDVLDYFDTIRQFSSSLNQIFGPSDLSDPPAVVLEINNKTRTVRTPEEDTLISPDIFLVLNWEDKLVPERTGTPLTRYWKNVFLIDSYFQRQFTIETFWEYLGLNSGTAPNSVTLHSMIFLPEQMKVALSFWTSYENVPARNNVWYDFSELFYEAPDGSDDTADDSADDDSVFADDSDPTDDTSGHTAKGSDENGGSENNSCGC